MTIMIDPLPDTDLEQIDQRARRGARRSAG
jgi:hypothetical protein